MKWKYTYEMVDIDKRVSAIPVGDGADKFHAVANLNQTALDLFMLLQEDRTEDELIGLMQEKFEVSRDILARDVRNCIKVLMESGFIAA